MSEWIKLDILNRDDLRGHSSKGNQLKAKDGIYWYKADCMGYEGLAETVVSSLLSRSDILAAVDYEPMKMEFKSHVYTGCRSRSFLMEGESLITVEKLIRLYTGKSAARTMASMADVKERICYLVNVIAEITGMTDFGKYLTAMLEIDAFFLNEDRHTNNIGVVYHPETRRFRHCPYFDHGLALLADTMTDFPLGEDLEKCMEKIEAKPFSRSFDEQMDAAEELYGQQVHFRFSIKEAVEILEGCRPYYQGEVLERVEQILRWQVRKYSYLFQ